MRNGDRGNWLLLENDVQGAILIWFWRLTIYYTVFTHFMSLISFSNPWKYQKNSGFVMYSEVIERDHWYEIGF